jgi:hypothetical protein
MTSSCRPYQSISLHGGKWVRIDNSSSSQWTLYVANHIGYLSSFKSLSCRFEQSKVSKQILRKIRTLKFKTHRCFVLLQVPKRFVSVQLHILWQTKNWSAFSSTPRFFVPALKLNLLNTVSWFHKFQFIIEYIFLSERRPLRFTLQISISINNSDVSFFSKGFNQSKISCYAAHAKRGNDDLIALVK